MRPLLLSSGDGSHTGASGYSAIARCIPDSDLMHVRRSSPGNPVTRLLTAINRRLTLVCWAWGSSLRLEAMALRCLIRDPHRVVHYLWADRDMAYLDLLKQRMGFKLVGTFHNCPDQLENLFNFPRRLKAVDHFIVVSSCQVDSLLNNGIPREKISVILHGVDSAYFCPGVKAPGGKFRVLSVGSWRRDFACMEEVFRSLGQRGDVECTCLIESRWRERWASIPNLRLPERVSDEELLRLYQESDVLLMCAEASTANNALVEALACGLPVVGTDVGGVKEYCTDAAGLFVDRGDAYGAVMAVLQLKESKVLSSNLAQGARRRGQQLDWRHIVAQTMSAYRAAEAA